MLTQESQELLNSIFEQIDRMKTEDIKQFMNIAISKNTARSGATAYPILNIMGKYGEIGAQKTAEIGSQDIVRQEDTRRYEETRATDEKRYREQQAQRAEELALTREEIARQEEEAKKAARDYWKPILGTVVGTAAGSILGPVGMAAGASIGNKLFSSATPSTMKSYNPVTTPRLPSQYSYFNPLDPYAKARQSSIY